MSQPYYDSDLTDEEWAKIKPLLPPQKPVARERAVELRVVLNGIFYRADNGIKWRALPTEFGAWQPCIATFGCGCDWEFGSKLIPFWCVRCVWLLVGKRNPV